MTPFTVSHLNFHEEAKLDELRTAYSELHYILFGQFRLWTNLGWVNAAEDAALAADAVITVEFFSTIQLFCMLNYTNFSPDDFSGENYGLTAGYAISENFRDVNFWTFVRERIGGAMVDEENGRAGWRWVVTDEEGALQLSVGIVVPEPGGFFIPWPDSPDVFKAEHILGEWVFDDLRAVLSSFRATAGECSGVYGSARTAAVGVAVDDSEESPYPYGLTTTNSMSDTLGSLVPAAAANALADEGFGPTFLQVASSFYSVAASYKLWEGTAASVARDNGLSEDTIFYKWQSSAKVSWWANGGYEVLYGPTWLIGKSEFVDSVTIYHDTYGEEQGSTTSAAPSFVGQRIYVGTSFGSSDRPSPPTLAWRETAPEPMSAPPAELEETDPELYANWLAHYERDAEFYAGQGYGPWGEVPGYAFLNRYEEGELRTYHGGVIRLKLTYADAYVPVDIPGPTGRCPFSWTGGMILPPPPCSTCDACDGDVCTTCDGDVCPTCDGAETCPSDTCTSCDSCEGAADACPADICGPCDACDTAETCGTCNNCDACESCNTCDISCDDSEDTCPLEGCSSCESIEACNSVDMTCGYTEDYCLQDEACSQNDTCNGCDTCDGGEVGGDCNGGCDTCETCDTCDECETCNQCEACESACETCNTCDGGCDVCNAGDVCASCDGDVCVICDGGDGYA